MNTLMVEFAERLMLAGLHASGYRSRFVKNSVGRLHVLDARGRGSLPPLVLVHGLSSTCVHLIPMLGGLRPAVRRLILPDLPGHGFSELPPKGTEMPVLTEGLNEALDRVLDEPAYLFGSSLGGVVAIRYALARPSRVRGLILSSPAGASCTRAELDRVLGQFHVANHSMALDFVDRLMTVPQPVRQVLALGVRHRFAHLPLQELLATFSLADLLTPEELGRLSVPTLLIWGKEDRILPRSQFAFFRDHLPAGTRIEEPAGVGHAPYLQRPGVLTRSIVRFMRETEAQPRRSAAESAA